MTVPVTARRAGPFTGTGALVSYPFTFKVFEKADLEVTIATPGGVETVLVLDSDVLVTLNVDQDASPGGSVQYAVGGMATALPAGHTLVITSGGLTYEQTADLPQGGNFSPVVVENALDRQMMLLQNLRDDVERVLQLSVTTRNGVSTTLPTPEANRVIGWNETADALQNFDTAVLASVVAFGTARADQFTGNGVQTAFTLSANPGALANLDVSIGGATQRPTIDYAWSGGTTLTFASAPPNTSPILVRYMQALPQGTSTADQVTYFGASLADWFFGPIVAGADSTGVLSSTAAIAAADAAAAAAGRPLHVPPGTYLINASYTFTAPVIMSPGAKLKVTSSTVYLKFGAGFHSGLHYCLDVEGPTQFLKTEAIYPQWFGATGLVADDQSTALIRTFRAARGCVNGADAFSDARYGCATVRFTAQGQYRCRNVPVYCGTIIEGDWQGSLTGSCIVQIDYNDPALLMMPKNYGVNGAVLNNGVGQNVFKSIGFRSEVASSTFEGDPIIHFMSPAQATAYLGIAGDTSGTLGHIDTMFNQCWFKDGNTCIMSDESMLWVHLRHCTFDVCYRAVQHKGTAKGRVNSYGNIYYGQIWGAFDNQSSEATLGVSWYSNNDEFKAGAPQHGTVGYRRAWNYSPTVQVAGTFVKSVGSTFLRTDGLFGIRIGGSIFVKLCDTVDISGLYMKDPDSANNQKAIAIQDGVKHVRLQGVIISNSLASYTSSRMVSFFQAVQAVTDAVIDLQIVNTSASTIESALQSDFTLSGVDLRMNLTGNFTNRTLGIAQKDMPVPVVASASTIHLPPGGDVFVISGTTSIGTILTTGWVGRTVRLIFQGALTVTDGSNLKLNGNFVTTADDTLTLTCDGTNWYEVARSAN